MKIEYKNIIINQDNISQYRENGFVAASYNTQWDFLNNKLHGDDTIIIKGDVNSISDKVFARAQIDCVTVYQGTKKIEKNGKISGLF